ANAAGYVAEQYEPTVDDFVRLRGAVTERRQIYDADFRDIRNKIYAHKGLSSRDEMNKLLAKAKIDDLRNLIGFLHALHEALWELLHNGRRPTVCLPYFDPYGVTPLETDAPGEMVARDVISCFRSLTISGQA